jgi:hypothetical protein
VGVDRTRRKDRIHAKNGGESSEKFIQGLPSPLGPSKKIPLNPPKWGRFKDPDHGPTHRGFQAQALKALAPDGEKRPRRPQGTRENDPFLVFSCGIQSQSEFHLERRLRTASHARLKTVQNPFEDKSQGIQCEATLFYILLFLQGGLWPKTF